MSRKRITLDLEENVLSAIDLAAEEQHTSRNQFIADSLKLSLRSMERQRVDAEFAGMAGDADYCSQLLQVELEMSPASEAAWKHSDPPGKSVKNKRPHVSR